MRRYHVNGRGGKGPGVELRVIVTIWGGWNAGQEVRLGRIVCRLVLRIRRGAASESGTAARQVEVSVPPSPAEESTPTFHSSTRLVIVNLVATDRDGNPIAGLGKDDFTVLEDGKAQQLQAFEPHLPVKQMMAIPDLHLPVGQFTNFPKQASNSAVNVVLFDILNTPTEDQLFARQESAVCAAGDDRLSQDSAPRPAGGAIYAG